MAIPLSPSDLSLTTTHPGEKMSGGALGAGLLTGNIKAGAKLLAGTALGAGFLTGSLTVPGQGISGSLTGAGFLTGALTAPGTPPLEGSVLGAGFLTGDLSAGFAQLSGTLTGAGFLTGAFVSDMAPIIPITTDLSPFFVVGELAHAAALNGETPFDVIVTDWYNELALGTAAQSATQPLLIAQAAEIPGVQEGDTVEVDGFTYTVRGVQHDNTGIVRLRCTHV